MDRSVLALALLLVHVGGAIVGFGPVFAFGILGPMAAKAGPNGGVAIMEAIVAVERRLVIPIAAVTQPLSGLALIFVAGWDRAFFSHTWLWVAVLIYVGAFSMAVFVQTPTIERMIALAKAGGPPTPEFLAAGRRTARLGPAITVMLSAIIVLMVVKPGG